MIRQRRGSNNKRQGRIKRKRPVTVIQAVTATLIAMEPPFETTTNVKAYYLPNSTSYLLAILL